MNVSIHIQNLKDIKDLKLNFPIEKGLYVVTGANGTGKSTIMTVFFKNISWRFVEPVPSTRLFKRHITYNIL